VYGGGSKQDKLLQIISAFEAKLNVLERVVKNATDECQGIRALMAAI
jgi:hypothetical protein